MSLRKVVLDTNLYIGWLNAGLHERVMTGPGLVRYLSAVVQMELRVGASTLPARRAIDHLLRGRSIGAAVLTGDRDFEAIRTVLDFDLEMVVP